MRFLRSAGQIVAVTAALSLVVAACGGSDGGGDATTTAEEATTTAPVSTTATPSSTTIPAPVPPAVSMLGPAEIVFDWSEDRCDDEMRPDLPVRAFRTADGSISMTLSDPTNFRLVGPDFDSLVPSCPAIRESGYDPDPSHYDHFQWMGATYTEDGETVHAIIHNEFHGDEAAGWLIERDYSLTQGESDWWYLSRRAGTVGEMSVVEGEWRSTDLCLIAPWGMHPDAGCDAVLRWVAPRDGTITVVASAEDAGQGGGDGVAVGIDGPAGALWEQTIDEGDTERHSTEATVEVAAGDAIELWVAARGDASFDATAVAVEINYGPRPCTGDRGACQQMSLTYAVSGDGGATWSSPPAPDHVVASVPERYEADAGMVAIWQPSNIVKHPDDGMYYMLVQYDYHREGIDRQWMCVMRTATLDDPSSWRAWDGEGFDMTLPDPYTNDLGPAEHTCSSVVAAPVSGLTWNTHLGQFVGVAGYGHLDRIGIYLVTSRDLITWSEPVFVTEADWAWTSGYETPYDAYPTIVDPASGSLSFDTSAEFPYLYYVRFNSLDPRDYDLLRVPLQLGG